MCWENCKFVKKIIFGYIGIANRFRGGSRRKSFIWEQTTSTNRYHIARFTAKAFSPTHFAKHWPLQRQLFAMYSIGRPLQRLTVYKLTSYIFC